LPKGRSRLVLFPLAIFALLIGPVAAGLLGAALPAFGYLPAIGLERFSLEPFAALLAMPGIFRSALLSLWAGLGTTFIAFAIVAAFLAGWHGTRLFGWLQRLVSPLLSVPHAATAFGLAFLIAPSGLVLRAFSPWATGLERPPDWLIVHDPAGLAMMAGLVVKEVPFLFLMALAALPQAEAVPRLRAARALGYGRMAAFLLAVLPGLYGQLRLPLFAVIAYASSVVDVALILGPTLPAPLAVRILAWQADPDLAYRSIAAAGAMLQLAVTGAAILVWWLAERLVARIGLAVIETGRRFSRERALRLLAAGAMSLAALLVLAGIGALALWSLAGLWTFPDLLPKSFGLSSWMRLSGTLATPAANAFLVAASSAALAVVLALGALEYEVRAGATPTVRALVALYLPLLVPQIAFLFGLDILFIRLGLDGMLLAVVLVHLVFVFPYVLLSLADPWRAFDPRYGQMAKSLGRGPDAVFWRVRLPMLARPVATAAALGFAVSVALYLPTLLIGAGRWPTVTTEAVALSAGGDPRAIGATALLQALLPFAGFALAALLPALLFRRRAAMRAAA